MSSSGLSLRPSWSGVGELDFLPSLLVRSVSVHAICGPAFPAQISPGVSVVVMVKSQYRITVYHPGDNSLVVAVWVSGLCTNLL
jgi:hypothetical protein